MPHCVDPGMQLMEPSCPQAPADRSGFEAKVLQLLARDHPVLTLCEVSDRLFPASPRWCSHIGHWCGLGGHSLSLAGKIALVARGMCRVCAFSASELGLPLAFELCGGSFER